MLWLWSNFFTKKGTPQTPQDEDSVNMDSELESLLQPLSVSHAETLSMNWTAILPREILFQIIDQEFHAHTPTLRKLALTCQILCCYVRKNLFQEIMELRCISPNTSNVKPFLLMIRQSPDILSFIQTLKINITSVSDPTRSQEQHFIERQLLCFIIKQRFPNLGSLRLTFTCTGYSQYRDPSLSSLYTAFDHILHENPTLKRLTLRGFASFWIELLMRTPNVLDLNIQDLQMHYGPSSESNPEALMKPTRLTVYDPSSKSAILNQKYVDLSQVSEFRFYGHNKFFISGYLRRLSSALTRLELYLPQGANYGKWINHSGHSFTLSYPIPEFP
ncbi:hypothetical protein CVT24_012674 [Panaeolus cyanescens]|uniref:Uncharacterized protein n=1 Tax=Panaeolus cyanescens TaxID=181874 RepID=A0A409YKD8_9AGAR|nr:hypothetical protein CVT24_012674 [Panaeolus cyanescens]